MRAVAAFCPGADAVGFAALRVDEEEVEAAPLLALASELDVIAALVLGLEDEEVEADALSAFVPEVDVGGPPALDLEGTSGDSTRFLFWSSLCTTAAGARDHCPHRLDRPRRFHHLR